MTLILGPDRAGNRPELAALVADDGTVVVIRRAVHDYLERPRAS